MPRSQDDLPSWKSVLKTAWFGAQIPFLSDPLPAELPSLGTLRSCSSPGLSCQGGGGYIRDTCCLNHPGGQFALTQFWNSDPYAGPPGYLGPNNTWTIHGLWPDHCDGNFDSVCDCKRSGDCSSSNYKCPYVCNKDYSSITEVLRKFGEADLLAYMNDHWKGINGDEHLWQHEWSKHGTCVSTLEPDCYVNYTSTQEVVHYFQKAVDVYKSLPSFEWLAAAGIVPSTEKTYTRAAIEGALQVPRGVKAIIQCDSRHPGELREIWYHYLVRGSLQEGDFVPSDPDFSGTHGPSKSCPDTGIRYLPKGQRASGPSPTKTGTIPTGTGEPVGKAHLVIKLKDGGERGCLISNGRWYNTIVGSSCATFRAHESGEGTTLRSSKGPCGVREGVFACGRDVGYTAFQVVDGKLIGEKGADTWSADGIPRGTEQEVILASDDGEVGVEILWRV